MADSKQLNILNPADFIGTTVHELNNYLSAISGFAELISLDLHDESCHNDYLAEILSAVDKTSQFNQKLLALAQRIPLDTVATSLAELTTLFERCDLLITGAPAFSTMLYCDKKWTGMAIEEVSNFAKLCQSENKLSIEHLTHSSIVYWVISHEMIDIDMNKILTPYYSSRELFSVRGLGLSWLPGFFKRQNGRFSTVQNTSDELVFVLEFTHVL